MTDDWYPKAKKITLVMDNFKTHAASAFYELFEPEEAKRLWDRFEFIYTAQARKLAEHGRNRTAGIKRAMFE